MNENINLDENPKPTKTIDLDVCWNCSGNHFITGYMNALVCTGCHEVQGDEEELVRDTQYDHW